MEILARVNLIDTFCLILYLRIIYIAISRGVLSESCKLAGVLAGIIFAFQYYSYWADTFANKIPFIQPGNIYFLSFLTIPLGITVIFVFLRIIITFILKGCKKDSVSSAERWTAFFLGLARASFLSSAIMFLLYLSPLTPQKLSQTFSYKVLKNLSPKVYSVLIDFHNKVTPEDIKPDNRVLNYYRFY